MTRIRAVQRSRIWGVTMPSLLLLALLIAGCGSGSDDSAKCDALRTDTEACLDDYCANEGSGTTVCGCWAQGQDVNRVTCECTPLDWTAICGFINLSDYQPGQFDCIAFQSSLQGVCE
jgi:hypothetical protein